MDVAIFVYCVTNTYQLLHCISLACYVECCTEYC